MTLPSGECDKKIVIGNRINMVTSAEAMFICDIFILLRALPVNMVL